MKNNSILSLFILFVFTGNSFSQVLNESVVPDNVQNKNRIITTHVVFPEKNAIGISPDTVKKEKNVTYRLKEDKCDPHLKLDLNKISDSIIPKVPFLNIGKNNSNEKASDNGIVNSISKTLIGVSNTGSGGQDSNMSQKYKGVGLFTRTLKSTTNKINLFPEKYRKFPDNGAGRLGKAASPTFKTCEELELDRNVRDEPTKLVRFADSLQKDKINGWAIFRDSANQQNRLPLNPASTSNAGQNSVTSAQQTPIVFPSPTASTLLGNIRENVDLYTGNLNVYIPIYNLKSYEIEVPIGLSYSSSGTKVDAIASSTGMGWSLNAGGSIARVMHGLPDEFIGTVDRISPIMNWAYNVFATGYLYTKDKVDLANYPSGYNADQQKHIIRCSAWYSYDWANDDGNWEEAEAWDTQPDEFYFSFGKYSGKFVFDQDGDINCIPFQNLKIDKTITNVQSGSGMIPKISEFTVTTEEGYVYHFGGNFLWTVEETQLEQTKMTTNFRYSLYDYDPESYLYLYYVSHIHNYIDGAGNFYYDDPYRPGNSSLETYTYFTSCWYLQKIETPGGDKVLFSYADNGIVSYVQSKSHNIKIPNLNAWKESLSGSVFFWSPAYPVLTPFGYILNELQTFTYSIDEVSVKSKKLSSITTSNGNKIDFLSVTPREDLVGDKLLDKIEIKHNNILVKSFDLSYDYQTSDYYYDQFDFSPYDDDPTNGPFFHGDIDFKEIKYLLLASNGNTPDPTLFDQHYADIWAAEHKRLYLIKVHEKSVLNSTIPPYEFTYDQQNILPRRFNYAQDKWGYMNSNTVGTTMPFVSYTDLMGIPFTAQSDLPPIGWNNLGAPDTACEGAVQSADYLKTLSLTLHQVIYPTGGGSLYNYELNTSGATQVGGLRVKEIKQYPDFTVPANYISKSYTYIGGQQPGGSIFKYELISCMFSPSPTGPFLEDVFASSHPVNTVLTTRGGIVGYRTVRESISSAGQTATQFFSPSVIPNRDAQVYQVSSTTAMIDVYPYPQDLSRDWQCGLPDLFKQSLADETKLVKRFENTYDTLTNFITRKYSWGLIPAVCFLTDYLNTFIPYPSVEAQLGGVYKFESGFLYKQKQVETGFNSAFPGNELKTIKKTTNFEFDKKDITMPMSMDTYPHTYLKSLSEINSDGKVFSEKSKYMTKFEYNS